jgi:hypothetical protein
MMHCLATVMMKRPLEDPPSPCSLLYAVHCNWCMLRMLLGSGWLVYGFDTLILLSSTAVFVFMRDRNWVELESSGTLKTAPFREVWMLRWW